MRSGFFILCFILLEIASFIVMADIVGLFRTLLLVVLSMGIGYIIFRILGEQLGMSQLRAMRTGDVMPNFDTSKLYLMFVAMLFMIPGFFSDILALLLFIPQVRAMLGKLFQAKMYGFQRSATNDQHVTIDGECEKVDKKDPLLK